MKRLFWAICSFSVILILMGTSSIFGAQHNVTYSKNKPINLLYTQTAKTGELKQSKEKAGVYILTLQDVGPEITYFSTEKNRIAGTLPTQEFIKNWIKGKNSFAVDNPNASIVYIDSSGNRKQIVVILSDPQYDADRKAFLYRVTPIKNFSLQDGKIKNIGVFIDDYGWCWYPGC